jgi:hypothetical protein
MPLNDHPKPPAVPEQRTPEFLAALDLLRNRLEALPALAAAFEKALQPVRTRVAAMEKQAATLQAIGEGRAPEVQKALTQGKAEFDRQAERIWAAAHRMTERRQQLLALMGVQRLVIRDFVDETANQDALCTCGRAIAAEGTDAYLKMRQWIGGRLERWSPRHRGPAPDDLGKILGVLPDLEQAAPSVPAPPVPAEDTL